ncbi:N-terminal EF-hand calcium-binding protein 3, partial [Antrostomus carolinensis]
YETSSKMEQFLTRFLLRETLQQLQSLQSSLECAVDTVEEQAGLERKDIKKSEMSVGLRSGRRCGRRGQKNICLAPTDPYSGMLTTGNCSSPKAGPWYQGMEHLLLAWLCSLSFPLSPPCCFPFHLPMDWRKSQLVPPAWEASSGETTSLWGATSCACQVPSQGHSCPHSVSACKLTDEPCFILYEFWQDVTSWRSHLQSSCSKTFQRAIISLLESPELLTTMLFPASWWIMNNN